MSERFLVTTRKMTEGWQQYGSNIRLTPTADNTEDETLCSTCSLFTGQLLLTRDATQELPIGYLMGSSYHCPLCSIIRRSLEQSHQRVYPHRRQADLDLLGSTTILRFRAFWHSYFQIKNRSVASRIQFEVIPFTWSPSNQTLASSRRKLEPILQRTLSQVRAWFDHCDFNHEPCKASTQFLPTRLLDIGWFEEQLGFPFQRPTPTSRLIETHNDSNWQPKYITLSHCWGDAESVTTTTRNIKRHMAALSIETLPATFKDAIKMTRALGVRYLWIDSLCIIQDSEEDWEKESSMMGQIYSESFCTISASTASSCEEGFWPKTRVRWAEDTSQRYTANARAKPLRIFEGEIEDWHQAYSKGPLRTRAWVLQERQLSRRILHFTENQVLWECRSTRASEQVPWKEFARNAKAQARLLDRNSLESSTDMLLDRWDHLVEDYTQRSLTFESDKLPAISGLARMVQDKLGNYSAGLWEIDLARELLWHSKRGQGVTTIHSRPNTYRAPSWSWAALQGPVNYSHLRTRASLFTKSQYHSRIDIQELSLTPLHSDTYGQLQDGFLRLSGRLKSAALKKGFQNHSIIHGGLHYDPLFDPESERCIGIISQDVPSTIGPDEMFYCLEVLVETGAGEEPPAFVMPDREPTRATEYMSQGLILSPVGGFGEDESSTGYGINKYERVGFFRFVSSSWFDSQEESTIIIV